MLSPGEQIETLNSTTLKRKFERLDAAIGTLKNFGKFEEDFKMEASLIGSGYIIDVAGLQDKHVEYKDKDVDIYVPNKGAIETLVDNNAHFYSDAVDGQFYGNINMNWSAPLEIHTEITYDMGSENEKRRVEEELTRDIEDPFATAYEGDNLEVTLPDPETYADTKNASNEQQAQIYQDQLRTLEYILEEDRIQDKMPRNTEKAL